MFKSCSAHKSFSEINPTKDPQKTRFLCDNLNMALEVGFCIIGGIFWAYGGSKTDSKNSMFGYIGRFIIGFAAAFVLVALFSNSSSSCTGDIESCIDWVD